MNGDVKQASIYWCFNIFCSMSYVLGIALTFFLYSLKMMMTTNVKCYCLSVVSFTFLYFFLSLHSKPPKIQSIDSSLHFLCISYSRASCSTTDVFFVNKRLFNDVNHELKSVFAVKRLLLTRKSTKVSLNENFI